jgi:hypothetical protein
MMALSNHSLNIRALRHDVVGRTSTRTEGAVWVGLKKSLSAMT